jgi:hypothetical protein
VASIPLNQRASATPAGGAVTLSFQPCHTGRIWQGSVIIPGAATNDSWQLTIGGQLMAIVIGSGPFGPVQVQPGQVLSLVGTVTLGTPYVAILSGINDPAGDASPYTGPAPLPAAGSATTGLGGGQTAGGITVPLLVNAAGNLLVDIVAPPLYASQFANALNVGNGSGILAAPAIAWYLFGWDALCYTAADMVSLQTAAGGGPAISWINCPVVGTWYSSPPLGPLRVTTGIWIYRQTAPDNISVILRLAPGT